MYKTFYLENRHNTNRDITAMVVIPFHSGEIRRDSSSSDPLRMLNETFSVEVEGVAYNTLWTETTAPWHEDEDPPGYVRHAKAEFEINNLPPGRNTGAVTRRDNIVPDFNLTTAVETAIDGLQITPYFSGVTIATDSISGSSSGTYQGQLMPYDPGMLGNSEVYQRGLKRVYHTESWVGKEEHWLGQSNTPAGDNVTGFAHYEFWGEVPSNSTYMDFTIYVANDKLRNPVVNVGGQRHSVYYALTLSGLFWVHFTGGSSDMFMSLKHQTANGITTTDFNETENNIELPLGHIYDGQGWMFRGVLSFSSAAEATMQSRFPIIGLPTWHTWREVGIIEYPVPQADFPQDVVNDLRRESIRQNDNLWNQTYPAWRKIYNSASWTGAPGAQLRWGRISRSATNYIKAGSLDGLDVAWISEMRRSIYLDKFRGLNRESSNIWALDLSTPVQDGFRASARTYLNTDMVEYFFFIRGKSHAHLGRVRSFSSDSYPVHFGRERAIDNGQTSLVHFVSGYRPEHPTISPSFYVALVTDDPAMTMLVDQHAALSLIIVHQTRHKDILVVVLILPELLPEL